MTDRRVSDERAAELAQLIALVRTSIGPRGSDPGAVDQLAAWMLSYGEGLLEDRAADRAEIERLVEELDVRKAQIDGALAQLDRGERKRIEALRLLREAADEIIDLAESLHEAIEQEQEIAGSAYVDPLVDLHSRLTAALERPDAAPPAPDADPAVLARHAAVQAGDLSGAVDLPDKRDADDLLPQITAVVRDADRAFERAGGSTRHWVRDCFLPLLARAGLTITAVRSGEPDPRDAVVEEGRKIIDISWDAEARQWLATGINPPGLVTGAPTIAELWRKIAQIVPALDAAGRQGEEQ